jgi:hypothetical protein
MVTGHAVEMFLADAGSDNEGAAVEVAVGACATLVGSTDVDAGDGADAADDDGIGEETCWLLQRRPRTLVARRGARRRQSGVCASASAFPPLPDVAVSNDSGRWAHLPATRIAASVATI